MNTALERLVWQRAGSCFVWDGATLVGRTHTGRVTLTLFEINRFEAVELREALLRESQDLSVGRERSCQPARRFDAVAQTRLTGLPEPSTKESVER